MYPLYIRLVRSVPVHQSGRASCSPSDSYSRGPSRRQVLSGVAEDGFCGGCRRKVSVTRQTEGADVCRIRCQELSQEPASHHQRWT